MAILPRFTRSGAAALAAAAVLLLPTVAWGQVGRPGVGAGGFGGGFGGGFPGLGLGLAGGGGAQQGGVGQPATMVPNRMYQYSSATGSGILQGPLIIQSQFGGAGGVGGQNYAGGGGTYGGLGGALGGLGGLGGNQQGQYSMFPGGFQLNFSYNTLVGLPSQQGQLGGGFGANPIGRAGGVGGFPGGGFGGGFPGGGFGGGFPGGGFGGGFPGGFGGGFPGKGGFGNGAYGY